MAGAAQSGEPKPATAARIYDYHLGGIHNFPADREAADAVAKLFPLVPALARNNRAFLRRAVRHLAESGVRQFLDIGSGIPTAGNVHEVARTIVPDAKVVYVDLDPVAVSESLEILDGDERSAAVRADLRDPDSILTHSQVRRLINFREPVAVLLIAVLHFVPDDEAAVDAVSRLCAPLVPGSFLAISHASADGLAEPRSDDLAVAKDLYQRSTTTPFHLRSRPQVERFFAGQELLDPGVVWLPEWRPAPDDPTDFTDRPALSAGLAGVGRVR
ncbi:SAM-dependent methyltransferase [Dactylosporangium sucinum]|uniref:S-adenosyl methyltransferase n=1 Tax=Dactylosporangium sucinum TaxID=1424081 RepID=A0A917U374_9ACTN|nr:SAM-dependent methyltransferase [Dactylosporangium sucinum]GGM54353.1 hypothetical protein GCM10007977_064960 [Dactylosporangium sucinum]